MSSNPAQGKFSFKHLFRGSHACGHISVMPECSNKRTFYKCVCETNQNLSLYYYLASHNTVFTQRHLNTRGVGRIRNSYANTRRLRKYILVRFTNIVNISDSISYERIIPSRPEFIKLFVVPIYLM